MDIKQKIETFDTTFIDKAVKLNIESGFYSEPQTKLSTHPFFPYFRKKIKQLFQNTYKENAFIETYMGENVPTLEIVETIFNRLKNIWDSQNSNLIIAGTNKNKDIVSFLSEYLKWFRTTGWEALKNKFNSFICVDIKDNKPYIFLISPENVKYLNIFKDKVQEIIFSFDNTIFYYYTNLIYSVYTKTNNNYILQHKHNHKLGECPVNFFISENLNGQTTLLKKNIITTQFDDLHKYIIKATELYISELHTSDVKQVLPDTSCGYSTDTMVCEGGRMYYLPEGTEQSVPVMLDDNTQRLCPNCGHNRFVGTGAGLTVDYGLLSERGINVNDLIKYFAPPLEGTEYQFEKLRNLKENIIKSSVGVIQKLTAQNARNEIDVQSDFEESTKILTHFGAMYAETINFAFRIILKLENVKFESVSFTFGNKFYLLTKNELLAQKEKATNPISRLEAEKQLIELEYKNAPDKKKAIFNAYAILPFSGVTDTDFLELIKLGKVSDFDIELRFNFNFYISEFIDKHKNELNLLDRKFIKQKMYEFVNIRLNTNLNNNTNNNLNTNIK